MKLVIMALALCGAVTFASSSEDQEANLSYQELQNVLKQLREPSSKRLLAKSRKTETYRVTLWPSLRRTPKSYWVSIRKDGTANFIHSRLTRSGDSERRDRDRTMLPASLVAQLLNVIEDTNFWALPNEFTGLATRQYIDETTGEALEEVNVCMDGTIVWAEGIRGDQYHWSSHGCSHNILDPLVRFIETSWDETTNPPKRTD